MDNPNSEVWAIVEVMGHSHYAGRVSEHTGLGVPLVRVEIPATRSQPAFEKLLGASSIFRITPCTEDVARLAAEQFCVRPLSLVSLPGREPGPACPPPYLEDYGDDED